MIITYHGNLHLKLQTGDTVISVNPVSKESGKKTAKYGSDICLISNNLPICSGSEMAALGSKEPFIINSPGEYEKMGISIKGVASTFEEGGNTKINTSYVFTFDGIKVCVLGILQGKLSGEARDAISNCDLLILPVLEGEKLSYLAPSTAESVAVSLDAKIVIPVGYDEKTLGIFLKESGTKNAVPLEKLTIKKKDVDGKDGEVIVLSEI